MRKAVLSPRRSRSGAGGFREISESILRSMRQTYDFTDFHDLQRADDELVENNDQRQKGTKPQEEKHQQISKRHDPIT